MDGASGGVDWSALELRAERKSTGRRSTSDVPAEPLSWVGAETKGNRDAKVALMVFTDFQCPYCGQFANEVLPEIDRRYLSTGKVLLIFRHLPIENIHPQARDAAESSLCAARQGAFWSMHDRLFGNRFALDGPTLRRHAEAVGVDLQEFDRCLSSEGPRTHVTADLAAAKQLGIFGTPAFLIGPKLSEGTMKATARLNGTRPFADFQQQLEATLASVREKEPRNPRGREQEGGVR